MSGTSEDLLAEIERQLDEYLPTLPGNASAESRQQALAPLLVTIRARATGALADEVATLLARTAPADVRATVVAVCGEWLDEEQLRSDAAALSMDPEIAAMFTAEALDHLGTIEATLLRLEQSPTDSSLLNDVFRPFHTIKGNAGAIGVTMVQACAHKVENLLDRCRSGAHQVGSVEVEVVLRSVDLLTSMIHDLSTRAAGGGGRSLRADRVSLMASVDALIAQGSSAGRAAVLASTAPAPAPPDPTLSSVVAEAAADQDFFPGGPSHGPVSQIPSPQPVPAAAREPREREATVKVDTRKLDGLVDTIGELVILQSLIYDSPTLTHSTDEKLVRNLAQLRRVTTELQRGAMSMRMVPIRQTFQKMSRLVRDLGKLSGKPVELQLSGEETELDRKVVEDINDPLMHMVRNSVDHGLEGADVREAAGKPRVGRLALRAFHQSGNIVIQVADDGAGLKTDRILAKAIAHGLVPPGETLTPQQIHRLIFRPGFSTADQVTEISGRGVGMDVVRRNIEALRGRIEIESEPGRGTTFSVKLPLTLAIVDGLVVTVGGERFVIPTFAVRESLRPQPAQVHAVQGSPRMVQVRDRLLPLLWLSEFFGLNVRAVDPSHGTVIVIEEDRRRLGLVVDALVGKQEVVVKPLGEAFAGVSGVEGGAILGDGRIGLILDAHGIVKSCGSHVEQGRPQAA